MVPLKWQLGEFFPSAAAAFLCGAFGCLGGASGPGVCWSLRSTLSLEINLDTAPVQKYFPWSVFGFMVSDWEGSGHSFYSISFFSLSQDTHLDWICLKLVNL